MKNTKLRYLVNFAVLALLFAAVAVMGLLGGNTVKLKITPSIWQCSYLIIMAASLNLVLGFLGQLSLGHCGFMAVGAYTAALISLAFQRAGVYTEKSGPAFLLVLLLSILAAGAAAALLGLLVGIPALRLKGDYLAIITLGFGMIIVNIINAFQSFTLVKLLTSGGPQEKTNLIVYSIYLDAFRNFRFGTAAARSIVLFVIIMVIALLQFSTEKRSVHY